MTKTSTPTPGTLRAEADKIEADATEARARADAAAQADAERRRLARYELRQQRRAGYDPVALEAEVDAARERFAEAILDNRTGYAEFLSWCETRTRHHLNAREAESARIEAGDDAPINVPGAEPALYSETVQQILNRAASRRLADLQDALQAELDEAGA